MCGLHLQDRGYNSTDLDDLVLLEKSPYRGHFHANPELIWEEGRSIRHYSPTKNLITSLCLFILHSWSQFRYKTRVYKQTNLDEKQLAKLHTKVRVPPLGVPRCTQSTLSMAFFSSLSP